MRKAWLQGWEEGWGNSFLLPRLSFSQSSLWSAFEYLAILLSDTSLWFYLFTNNPITEISGPNTGSRWAWGGSQGASLPCLVMLGLPMWTSWSPHSGKWAQGARGEAGVNAAGEAENPVAVFGIVGKRGFTWGHQGSQVSYTSSFCIVLSVHLLILYTPRILETKRSLQGHLADPLF